MEPMREKGFMKGRKGQKGLKGQGEHPPCPLQRGTRAAPFDGMFEKCRYHARYSVWGSRTLAGLAVFTVCLAAAAQETPTPEQAVLAQAAAQYWPKPEELPLPADGWYTLELGGDKVDVFRDAYGVPHLFAPSVEAVFRAQGYVVMEDRCIQMLKCRDAAMGRLAAVEGASALSSDFDMRIRGYTVEELDAMVAALRPDLRQSIEEYVAGVNAYLDQYAPKAQRLTPAEVAACTVVYVSRVGDGGAEEHHINKFVSLVRFLKGDAFMRTAMHDCLPLDVPNAPTTDHSDRHVRQSASRSDAGDFADFDPMALAEVYDREESVLRLHEREGILTRWGSQVWAVNASRSATGRAMLFASPMMGFSVPSPGVQVHLVAPGLNVTGIASVGFPGVMIGHNERVAWGVTSGVFINQSDMFVETVNPDNGRQYKHKGAWKDMTAHESPIAVRGEDGTLEVRPLTVLRTVHGPVVQQMPYNHRAYSRAIAHDRLQLESMAAFLDIDRATNVYDMEGPVRRIAASHNIIAADADGNIAFWLSGRIPKRNPEQDIRLPAPGTGECDWQGLIVATDLAQCVNPPEGWLGNFNNKPSVNTPGWWPERLWGQRIFDILDASNPMDWNTLLSINPANGEHHFGGPFFQDFLVRILRERAGTDAQFVQALDILEQWPSKDLPGSVGALLMNEWMMEATVEVMQPDFGFLVEHSLSNENMQLFGLTMYRALRPETAGFKLKGDYLHGRNPDDVAFACLSRVIGRLTQAHGADLRQWPYEPPRHLTLAGVAEFPNRNCGTYWIATELSTPPKSVDMLVPGESERAASPHFQDQFPLFQEWKYKDMPFMPADFGRPAETAAPPAQ